MAKKNGQKPGGKGKDSFVEKQIIKIDSPRLHKTESFGSFGTRVFSEYAQFVEAGNPKGFTEARQVAAKHGFFMTSRHSLLEKTRHDVSAPKSIQFHIKTENFGPYKGHLPIPDNWKIKDGSKRPQPVKNEDGTIKDDVFQAIYYNPGDKQDEKVYVTYEKQSLRYIQTALESGLYKFEDIQENEEGVLSLYIKDEQDKTYCIDLNKDNLKAQNENLIASVSTLKNLFEAKSSKDKQQDKSLMQLFKSPLWTVNIDKTARILRAEKTEENKWKVDNIPHIACDENGAAIKGDVDQKNFIIPMYVPLSKSLKLIDIDAKKEDLITNLTDDFKVLQKSFKQNDYLFKIIDSAIERLKEANNVTGVPIEVKNRIITDMGNIELVNAAFVLGLNSVVLHGSDGVSPIFPENYARENIPTPDGKIIETYGEFNYLEALYSNEDMFENSLVNFNTCEFARASFIDPESGEKKPKWLDSKGNAKMRVNKDEDFLDTNKVRHTFNNFADEDYSIELRCLLYERQLLNLKLNNEEKFEEYINSEKTTYQTQKARSKDSNFILALDAGWKVRDTIINNVKNIATSDIKNRLADIRNIGTDAENRTIVIRANEKIVSRRDLSPPSKDFLPTYVLSKKDNKGKPKPKQPVHGILNSMLQKQAYHETFSSLFKDNLKAAALKRELRPGSYLRPR